VAYVETDHCDEHRNVMRTKLLSWRSFRNVGGTVVFCGICLGGFLFTSVQQHGVALTRHEENIKEIKGDIGEIKIDLKEMKFEQRERYEELRNLIIANGKGRRP